MDYEVMLEWMAEDFKLMAEEHEGTASNIHLAALGTEDDEEAGMSEEFADMHRELAEVYHKLAKNPVWLLNRINGGELK